MMKRTLYLALLLAGALALAACGKKETGESAAAVSENTVSDNTVSEAESAEESLPVSVSDNAAEEETFDYSVLPEFATEDLEGNAVTNEIFAGKDITMVNFWGTFCAPCISEMPELGKLAAALPENAQMIGLVCDVTYQNPEDVSAAAEIVESTGASFTHIILDENLLEFSSQFFYVPTTFFVDSEGKVLGDPIIGANVDAYIERLGELLDGWSYEG